MVDVFCRLLTFTQGTEGKALTFLSGPYPGEEVLAFLQWSKAVGSLTRPCQPHTFTRDLTQAFPASYREQCRERAGEGSRGCGSLPALPLSRPPLYSFSTHSNCGLVLLVSGSSCLRSRGTQLSYDLGKPPWWLRWLEAVVTEHACVCICFFVTCWYLEYYYSPPFFFQSSASSRSSSHTLHVYNVGSVRSELCNCYCSHFVVVVVF